MTVLKHFYILCAFIGVENPKVKLRHLIKWLKTC